MNIYWNSFKIFGENFVIAKTNQGVCLIDRLTTQEAWQDLLLKKYPDTTFIKDELNNEINEVLKYINGEIQSFSFSYDVQGTEFQKEVWEYAASLPYGQTITYKQLAEAINRPHAVRAVGAALGANCILFRIPCHRVIASSGKLTGYRGGNDLKKYLLTLENK